MERKTLNREEGSQIIHSIDDWKYIGVGYVGSKGLINAVLSEYGRYDGGYDGREFGVTLYISREVLWYEGTIMRHKDLSQLARELYEEVEKKYEEKNKITDKGLVQHSIDLLDAIKEDPNFEERK